MTVELNPRLRVILSRAGLLPGEYRGDYDILKRLYKSPDPWRLQSANETRRFELTCATIKHILPDCRALLEIGSGEGLQTVHFATIAKRVTGIELSALAVERARVRVPEAAFHVGMAENAQQIVGHQRFDLVTACEVLYYSPDAAQILAGLQSLAPRVFVTNQRKQVRRLGRLLDGPKWRRLPDMRVGRTVWQCDLWERSPQERAVG